MDGRLNFKATIDDADFNRKLNNMEKGVDGLKFDAPTKSLDGLNKKLLETKQRLQENQNELKRLNAQISNTAPGAVKNNLLGERNALSRSINEDKAAVIGYKQEITNLNKELSNTSKGGSTLKSTLSSLTSYFGALVGIGTVVSLLRSFYDTTKQLQVLNKSMELGAKDSQAYASNVSFLSDITEKYGLELINTSQAYNKFYTASKNKLGLEEIQLIFEKVSKSASLMGLSVADQAGIFRALEQMMSKGTVQAEELRGQLGDRLPGAFEIMANAMDVSTEKLGDMMKNGEVMSADVLPKFAIELEKAFGADKVEMVDNLVASENRLKNAWTEFVAEVNGTDNAIGNFIISFMGAISTALSGLSRLSASWDSIFKKAREQGAMSGYEGAKIDYTDYDKFESQRKKALQERQQLLKKERELTEDLKNGQEALAKADERRIMPTWLGGGAVTKDANKNLEKINRQLGYTQDRIRAINELEQKYQNPETETNTETEKQLKKREAEEKRALKQAESSAKKRLDFIFELNKAENDLTQTTLSGLDLELSKVNEVYNDRIKKAKELKATQDAFNKIESLKTKETEIVVYKNETSSLVTSLEQQKTDYEAFEEYKKQVGVAKAKEMYSEIIDASKSYYDVLNDELNSFSGREDLTALEKQRVDELFKLLQNYSTDRINKERQDLQALIQETATYQERISLIQETYSKKRKDLEKITDEQIRNEKLAVLNQQEKDAVLSVENEVYEKGRLERDLIKSLTSYTKKELQNRLKSTREYLDTYGDYLSEDQKKSLESEALLLTSIIGATDKISRQNALLKEKERITKAIKNNTSKDPEIAKKLNKELEDVNGLLDDNTKETITTAEGIQMAVQGANMLASAFGGVNKELQMAVEAIGNIVSALASGDMAGAVMAVAGTIIQGAVDVFGKNDTSARDSEKLRLQEEYNKMLRDQLLIEARINDEYQSRVQAIREEMEVLSGNQKSVISRMKEILNTFYELYKDFGGFGSVNDFDFFTGWQGSGFNEYFENGVELSDELLDKLIQLNAEAPLQGTMKELFDELMRLKEEFGSVDDAVKELEKELRDRLTGTTAQSLADSIREGIADGKRSFEDFANDIEGFLRNAILAGMSQKIIEPQIQQLQDMLYEMMQDGILTEEERRKFEERYAEIAQQAGEYLDLVNQAGVNMGGLDDLGTQSAKDGIKRITESQADRLTGILTGMQVDVIESRKALQLSTNLLNSSLDNLIAIEFNTRRTYEGVERIEVILQNNQNQALGL